MADVDWYNADQDSFGGPQTGYSVSQRLRQLFQPQSAAQSAYTNLAGNMPQRPDPSTFQKIAAIFTGLGAGASPVGMSYGGPVGFRYNPQAAAGAQEQTLYGDYDRKLVDWKNQLDALKTAAVLESQRNVEGLGAQTSEEKIRSDIEKEKQGQEKIDISNKRADAYVKWHQNPSFKPIAMPGGNLMLLDPTNPSNIIDTGYPSGKMTDEDKENFQLKAIRARGEAQAGVKATVPGAAPQVVVDPTTETTQIIRPTQGTATPVVNPTTGQPIGAVEKPGTPKAPGSDITTSTKNLRDQAQLILPGLGRLKDQAVDLEKRQLFGVIMSRVRDAAAKIGTTGDTASVQASLDQFQKDLASIKGMSSDFAVGEFLANLDLVASGVARAHGRAGSAGIGMVKQMKQALSSDSTIDMFLGRLKAFDDQMHDYAVAGIKPLPAQQLPFDKLIDDALKNLTPSKKPEPKKQSFLDIVQDYNNASS